MMTRLNSGNVAILALSTCAHLIRGQFPANLPQTLNLTTIASPTNPEITISYKTPDGACKTAFESQQQYTGWVNVPGDYPTNTFFWYVGARDQQASSSLTIWLNGGPGSSSMFGFFTETGPCEVVDDGLEKFTTVAREWGWDRASNMLFIDQPNQVGFSYDVPTNGSIDLLTNQVYTPPAERPNSLPPIAYLDGTFSSQNPNNTANTTEAAAVAIWHMLQGLFSAFPQLSPPENSILGVNLFTESYGGKYGPVFAEKWEEMNMARNSARNSSVVSNTTTMEIHLAALGIVNGCVDDLIQAPYYPTMAVNNTYGLKAINSIRAGLANASFYRDGGCRDLITECRAVVSLQDPNNTGSVADVNSICQSAYHSCTDNVMLPYTDAGRSVYDIAAFLPDSFPPSRYLEYVNTAAFQLAIGTTLNYTETNNQVVSAFMTTGDYEREAMVPKLAALLDSGIRVGFMYGDRDYICNWLGGEAISLAVASSARNYSPFASAGYAPIIVNDSYIGGVVRQFGNLSFSRIYQAGHFVPAYQPEAAFEVFARIIMGDSVSTGEDIDLSTYNTTGPLNATSTLDLPSSPTPTCWLRNMPGSCSEEQKSLVLQGEAIIVNGALQSSPVTSLPGTTVTATATETEELTGFFTATATPSSAAQLSNNVDLGLVLGGAAAGIFVAI
ncbi:Alpha/Beta hydrolase protein [Biscogniauxia marginata]|nr:Alpha/Beta hydrolase protein [Biscogniauxia marginata]